MTRVLDVSNLEGGYGSVQILYGIDMHVDEGEFVTIIGPNGCGKSTLIKTIFGIATYYGGGVEYRGQDVSGWRTDQLVNHGIAYVPQVDNVFPSLSVLENLQMGGNSLSKGALIERIERSLEMFPDLRNREYDLAASLSGGERQMLAISRALISDPKFLLLDEPTNDLDVDTLRALEDALVNFAGCAVVISHDRWFLDRIATHILAFEGDSHVEWFEGNYEDYEADRRRRMGGDADQPHRIKYRRIDA